MRADAQKIIKADTHKRKPPQIAVHNQRFGALSVSILKDVDGVYSRLIVGVGMVLRFFRRFGLQMAENTVADPFLQDAVLPNFFFCEFSKTHRVHIPI